MFVNEKAAPSLTDTSVHTQELNCAAHLIVPWTCLEEAVIRAKEELCVRAERPKRSREGSKEIPGAKNWKLQ